MALYTMKEILKDAQTKKYGVGFFDVVNMEMARAYIHAAEECNSPIIIGPAEALLTFAPMEWIMPMMLEQARNAKVPVAVHLDHGYNFETVMKALRSGCGSVMFDGTRLPRHEDNIRVSGEIVKIAHAMGVGVECELGSVGGLSDETGNVDIMVYTEPRDCQEFLAQTDADFLAVSIGTQHGVYKAKPRLDIPRLKEIRAAVDAPLVLHGGSGLSDDDFRNTIAGGISKINVYTDILIAAKQAVEEHPEANYPEMNRFAEEAMKQATVRKLRLFGSEGKA